MSALYLTADLLFSSRVRSIAEARWMAVEVVMSPDVLVERAAEDGVRLAILDLTAPNCNPAELVPQLRAAAPQIKILAYGPHVQTERLNAARKAGCDEVVSNGQFHGQMAQLLAKYLQTSG